MQKLLETAVAALKEGKNLVIATIISENGSAPRSSGTKMLIFPDGTIDGTIGGGKLEAETIRSASEVFGTKQNRVFHFALTGKDAAVSDMICGGNGDILLQYIEGNSENRTIFRTALETAEAGQKGWLVTQFSSLQDDNAAGLCFIDASGSMTGRLDIPQSVLSTLMSSPNTMALHNDIHEDANLLIEQVQRKKRAFVFGGGHVSLEIVKFLEAVDFHVTVIDDRVEYLGRDRFPNAERVITSSFGALPPLDIDQESFIVIVTRGHLGDYDVLKTMLETDAWYIGMIGSRGKREKIYERLLREGVSQKEIDRVHSPIGLPIRAETPAEIAVSITAEMILSRARMNE